MLVGWFKKNFVGPRFSIIKNDEELQKLNSDPFYNKLRIVDEDGYEVLVYVPIILGNAEQVVDEFMDYASSMIDSI